MRVSDDKAACPQDRVNRQIQAERPHQRWVCDFADVSTWQGWLYAAFTVNLVASHTAGWRVSRLMTSDFVLDALAQALCMRQLAAGGGRHRTVRRQQGRQP